MLNWPKQRVVKPVGDDDDDDGQKMPQYSETSQHCVEFKPVVPKVGGVSLYGDMQQGKLFSIIFVAL